MNSPFTTTLGEHSLKCEIKWKLHFKLEKRFIKCRVKPEVMGFTWGFTWIRAHARWSWAQAPILVKPAALYWAKGLPLDFLKIPQEKRIDVGHFRKVILENGMPVFWYAPWAFTLCNTLSKYTGKIQGLYALKEWTHNILHSQCGTKWKLHLEKGE